MLADIDAESVAAVAREVGGHAVATDVSREPEIRSLVARARELGGPIDLFCSNAGVGGPGGGPEVRRGAGHRTWKINVMAHVWAARAVLPEMVERGEGYLMSTASAAGLLTQVSALSYSMTKHAAVALAEWLAITYADAGIKVSCLCPLGVRTPMLEMALDDKVGAAALLADDVLEHVVGEQRRRPDLVVQRHLQHRRAHPERAQARDLDPGVGVGDRQPLGQRPRPRAWSSSRPAPRPGSAARRRGRAHQVALAALHHLRQDRARGPHVRHHVDRPRPVQLLV